jgi:DNA-binding response OmpR family regulator
MRVLVVEDHPRLAQAVAIGLRREGMAVDVVFDGREALERASLITYDVVVLDRDLPVVHGDDVCRSLVADGYPSAVLMLTAAGTLEDRVRGLGIGADDSVQASSSGRARGSCPRARAPLTAARSTGAGAR